MQVSNQVVVVAEVAAAAAAVVVVAVIYGDGVKFAVYVRTQLAENIVHLPGVKEVLHHKDPGAESR